MTIATTHCRDHPLLRTALAQAPFRWLDLATAEDFGQEQWF